ncbi:PRD domain-containing protein [Breznakiella homolactica]|uniref:PRD domain-containing protein n=1 Tax=Breznakiella homolactica TaxID=2798577 RepID=A0A7T8BC93_9SPIR|nr:PRD domain-containing protein [Breznakiella homolactica]QQO10910.1 PRD domain-containing protein [Breznakiella homolactica]
MELDTRLELLLSSGTISEEVVETVRKVIQRMNHHWKIPLTEENGSRLITHLSVALMRLKRHENIRAMEPGTYEEFKNTPVFPKAQEIADDIIAFTGIEIPESEREYLNANVCLILEDE